MLNQTSYIHVTASLLDPHDIHHEGKNVHSEVLVLYLGGKIIDSSLGFDHDL